MLFVIAILAGVILLAKNTNNPNPPKSTSGTTSAPTIVTSAPDWYASTGTDITDNPPTTSTNLLAPNISKPPTKAFTLGNVSWNDPESLPNIQVAKYQSDQASIAPTPPPNPTFEATVPLIASQVYRNSLAGESVAPKWLE